MRQRGDDGNRDEADSFAAVLLQVPLATLVQHKQAELHTRSEARNSLHKL